jgi:hypothetical protein
VERHGHTGQTADARIGAPAAFREGLGWTSIVEGRPCAHISEWREHDVLQLERTES